MYMPQMSLGRICHVSARAAIWTVESEPALSHVAVLVVLSRLKLATAASEEVGAVEGVEMSVQIFLGTECAGTVWFSTGESRPVCWRPATVCVFGW